jgi:hypothetical protein
MYPIDVGTTSEHAECCCEAGDFSEQADGISGVLAVQEHAAMHAEMTGHTVSETVIRRVRVRRAPGRPGRCLASRPGGPVAGSVRLGCQADPVSLPSSLLGMPSPSATAA